MSESETWPKNEITLGRLVGDWFRANMPDHYTYDLTEGRFRDIHIITCSCHIDGTRRLGVVLDEDLQARIFTDFQPRHPYPYPDYLIIHAADPDFFQKFKDGILHAHKHRYGIDAP